MGKEKKSNLFFYFALVDRISDFSFYASSILHVNRDILESSGKYIKLGSFTFNLNFGQLLQYGLFLSELPYSYKTWFLI